MWRLETTTLSTTPAHRNIPPSIMLARRPIAPISLEQTLLGYFLLEKDRLLISILINRVSCTSVATARSSASRMESPNPSSSSARTLAGYLGLCSTVASTRRVSLKSVTPNFLLIVICGLVSKREGRDGEHRRAQQNMENSTRTTKRVFGSIGNYTRWCADG